MTNISNAILLKRALCVGGGPIHPRKIGYIRYTDILVMKSKISILYRLVVFYMNIQTYAVLAIGKLK